MSEKKMYYENIIKWLEMLNFYSFKLYLLLIRIAALIKNWNERVNILPF